MEVIVTGGGEYVIDILNAVAAFAGSGAMGSFIRLILIIGLAIAAWQAATAMNFKPGFDFIVKSMVLYLGLLVPTVPVTVTDRTDTALIATIDNVPVGLAVPAAITTQVGATLTGAFEALFAEPGDLQYSTHGFLWGARVIGGLEDWRILDPATSRNLLAYSRDCLFLDINAGRQSMTAVVTAPDLTTVLAASASPAAFTRQEDGSGAVSVASCQQAWTGLQAALPGAADAVLSRQGRLSKPYLASDEARAQLIAALPVLYQSFVGVSRSAQDLATQAVLVNAVTDAVNDYSAEADASAAVEAYAAARAEQQAKWNYTVFGSVAEKFINLLYIAITVIVIAIFPLIAPFFLLPGIGMGFLQKYFAGFLYLQMWGPLFAIIHFIRTRQGYDAISAAVDMPGGADLTIQTSLGLSTSANDLAAVGGLLVGMIPFLAAAGPGIALGLGRLHESFLAPVKSASQTAAAEAATGNLRFGNSDIGNASWGNQSAHQIRTSGYVDTGHMTVLDRDRVAWTDKAGGGFTMDDTGSYSRLRSTPITSAGVSSAASVTLGVSTSMGETWRAAAAQSYSQTVSDLTSLQTALSNSQSQEASELAERARSLSEQISDYGGINLSARTSSASLESTGQNSASFEAESESLTRTDTARWNIGAGISTPGGASRGRKAPKSGGAQPNGQNGGGGGGGAGASTSGQYEKQTVRGTREEAGARNEMGGAFNNQQTSSHDTLADDGQRWSEELAALERDVQSYSTRSGRTDLITLTESAQANYAEGEEFRDTYERYYNAASSASAASDRRDTASGAANVNRTPEFQAWAPDYFSRINGRPVSERAAMGAFVAMDAAEQQGVVDHFLRETAPIETPAPPVNYQAPNGGGFVEFGGVGPGDLQSAQAAERANLSSTYDQADRARGAETPGQDPYEVGLARIAMAKQVGSDQASQLREQVMRDNAERLAEGVVARYGPEHFADVYGLQGARDMLGPERFAYHYPDADLATGTDGAVDLDPSIEAIARDELDRLGPDRFRETYGDEIADIMERR